MARVLHASYSGYFPSCITSTTSQAAVFPLTKMMDAYWRVKRFSLKASGICTNFVPIYGQGAKLKVNFPEIIFERYVDIPGERIKVISENYLVCNSGFLFGGGTSFGGIEFSFQKSSSNLYALRFYLSLKDALIAKDGSTYDIGCDSNYLTTSFLKSPFKCEMLDVAFPVNAYLPEVLPPVPTEYQGTLSLTFNAIEWYSYDGIWNTKTGTRL